MELDKILVIVFGILGIIFTFWFFLMKKENITLAKKEIDVVVDGGYSPDVISIPQGEKIKINFLRKDPSSCLEEVVLPDFKIRKFLPLNKKITIEITPNELGEYRFSCGMNMFHGKIIVG